MRNTGIIMFMAFSAHGHAKEDMDKLVQNLIDRMFTTTALDYVDTDGTTMGKPAQSLGHSAVNLVGVPAASYRPQFQMYQPQFQMQGRGLNPIAAMRPAECGCSSRIPSRIVEAKSLVERAQTAASDVVNEVKDRGTSTLNGLGKVSAAMAVSAMLIATPAYADTAGAIKDFTDAAYPIIGSLKKDTVGPLTGKAIQVALTAPPKEIIKTIDAGLEAFLSTDSDKFIKTVKALEVATTEASAASSCNLICLPSIEAAENVGAAAGEALATADKAKVKAFADQAIKLVNSVDKFAAAPVAIEGAKFGASLNPGDVAKATQAALEIVQSSQR
eukprot:gnl/MRDRNA2_/MRDRNA2_36077_c0_seq1.p1 gnl/MRDRNA2_/MRDRNA2_36077_c0~~gnl/MRDRNA2_/MRDRNA2_36077_c0_seq1.p1  ORF type:complete len:330 (+),score=56.21 gnl/MRDRNA2_/MRDRNA2_36077_c0_seq1:96-1085(+)